MARRRVMIVTASKHQEPLLRAATSMGCEVLATDSQPDAPGLALADRRAIVDATDANALLAVASEFQPDAILTEQTDVAVPAVAHVAERLGIPGIGSGAARRATDKWAMREACRLAGLPTPKFRLAASADEAVAAARDIGLPVVVKPIDNQSSRGVSKVDDVDRLADAAAAALAGSRSGRILVEECMIGQEVSIESFVAGDRVHVLGISEKIKCAPPYSFDLQLIYPASHPPAILDDVEELNRQVIKALGISMGFAHAEMILTKDGARLIEIAARGCGARVATTLLPRLTGIDLLSLRLRQALGEQVDIPEIDRRSVGILRFFELPAGEVRKIEGLDEARAVPGVIHLEFTPTIGKRLQHAVSGDQRPGYVLAVADTRSDAIAIADRVSGLIAVEIA